MKINPDDLYDHLINPPNLACKWPTQVYLNQKTLDIFHTMKPSDKYRGEDGVLTLSKIGSDPLEDFIQEQWLDFCGCGRPESALDYVLKGLELIESRRELRGDDEWEEQYAFEDAHFGTSGGAWFFFYWACKEGFTEHGGSVPGWLDEKGQELLALLREWKEKQE